ncbi:MAG TPA: hypothetical protein VFF76_04685 [Holophagaceae bacterium]|jgi:hypothetical protein|nr:hypothetical protein [Holophagaceae bacterium]
MDAIEAWKRELDTPTEAFFGAFAARVRMPDGPRDTVREAIKALVPRIAWESYLPHVPHGLLGLDAVFRLRPLLPEASFHRVLATQLHAFAHEGRRRTPWDISAGSGHWPHVAMAIQRHMPALAYGEMQGIEQPEEADFTRVGEAIAPDMANMGHKAVMAHRMRELFVALDRPKATGRRLAGIAAWLAASEPEDRFWAKRAVARIGEGFTVPAAGTAFADGDAAVREICDLGLVEMLNAFTARLKAGAAQPALLDALVRAASEKQLDARRDLEGKTSWTFTYLATLAGAQAAHGQAWCQAAALVNLFPTDEVAGRVRSKAPLGPVTEAALVDAILDSEPEQAMGLAAALDGDVALQSLAEAATQNDPAFNHSHHLLAAAAAADLAPRISSEARTVMLAAIAKSLANSQGSSDLGRKADKAFAQLP